MEQKQLDEIDESYFGEELIDEEEGVSVTTPKKKTAKKSAKKTTKKAEPKEKAQVKKEPKVQEAEKSTPQDPWKNNESTTTSSGSGMWKALSAILLLLLVVSIFTQGFGLAGSNDANQITATQAEEKVLAYVNAELLQPPFSAEVQETQDLDNLYKVSLSIAGQSIDSYITKDGALFFPQGLELEGEPAPTSDSELEAPGEQLPSDSESEPTQEPLVGEAVEVTNCERNSDCAQDQLCMGGECQDRNAPARAPSEPTSEVEEAVVEEVEPVNGVANASEEEPAQEVVVQPAGDMYEVAVSSRKWSFTPDVIRVPAGEPVVLSVLPDNTNPTFALSNYEFSIAGLGVTEQITAKTAVEFTAQPGEYVFSCSSCDDWRGMHGTLIVE